MQPPRKGLLPSHALAAAAGGPQGPYAPAGGFPVVGHSGSPALRRLQQALERRAHGRGELSQSDEWVVDQRQSQPRGRGQPPPPNPPKGGRHLFATLPSDRSRERSKSPPASSPAPTKSSPARHVFGVAVAEDEALPPKYDKWLQVRDQQHGSYEGNSTRANKSRSRQPRDSSSPSRSPPRPPHTGREFLFPAEADSFI